MENSAPVDRLSNLPDELLCHILSFLSTKLAFTTAVLSKRWTPLIKLLTTLRFDEESFNNKEDFPRVVDTVMRSIDVIKTFHLNCHSKHRKRFDLWIKAAKPHPLENLELLSTFHCKGITLSPCIFISPTLVLKLTKLNVVDDISVDLPSLKTLHMIFVYLKSKDNFIKLLNGCPILEDLQTHIYYIEEQGEDIRLKTLSKLMRANIITYERFGFKDDIQFATYILKNAPLLRVMKIIVAEPSLSCWNALKELKACPRISPKCELSISTFT